MKRVHWHLWDRMSWRYGPYWHARVLWFSLDYLPSWDQTRYSKWGFWTRNCGFTLRYRGWLFMFR